MSTSQERAEQSSGYLAWLSYQHRGESTKCTKFLYLIARRSL
jgi:hypothetical protein